MVATVAGGIYFAGADWGHDVVVDALILASQKEVKTQPTMRKRYS